ncbi:short chain dehydrogenase family protein [Collimonas pratensis]|uniref:Short chain dehydrogenase family protein n=2 Tax=Collimonas pratensis TaxID=279113 RepID=A0A127QAH6_9BURK|nr:short chain dehydrogenase family protein [Collimonas pratensis]
MCTKECFNTYVKTDNGFSDMDPLSTYFPLKNKVALVTGAARGIALHIACALSAAGAHLAILDEREQEGGVIAGLLGSKLTEVRFWQLDVSDNDAVQRVMVAVEAHFGRIDILINSAGVDASQPYANGLLQKHWEKAMQANVNGSILCSKHVAPAMERAGGGSIVNVLSPCAVSRVQAAAADHAAKATLRMSSMNAMRYATQNIRVNAIHPGVVRPPALAAAMRKRDDLTQALADRAELQMQTTRGSATDVAAAVLYLASDASRFVTGGELVIDAGPCHS